jgi:putative hydrolase of the HAD superfamily
LDNKTIIFIDGDDTLWDTQGLYDRAICNACEKVRLNGLDVARWSQAVHDAEMELMPKFGFAKERFAAALVQVYNSLCKQQGKTPSVQLSNSIQGLGMHVFEEKAPLLAGATETVETVSAYLPIYLVSAGPEDIQKKRMLDSGLEQFLVGYRFPAQKTEEIFGSLISELNVEPAISWHIGNSIKSDVNPARQSGLNAILVGERGWAYDKDELCGAKTNLERVSQLCDVIPILRRYYDWSE